MHLGGVLGSILDVVAQQFAQATKFGLAGVLEAELEGLQRRSLIHNFQARIVAEDVKHGAIGLPQKLEPRGDDGAVSPVARLLARDRREQDGLGRLNGLEIFDVGRVRLEARLDLISLGLGLGNLFLGQLDEALEDQLCYWSV